MLKVDQNFQIAIQNDSKLQFKIIKRLVDRGIFTGAMSLIELTSPNNNFTVYNQ